MQQHQQVLQSKHNNRPFALDIRWEMGQSPQPVILFIHGFKGFKDWGPFNLMADTFAKAGFVFAKMNLSHNGTTIEQPIDFPDLEAFGHNNFSIELDDIGVALDFLSTPKSNIPINTEEIYLIGHSRGGGLVLLKAAEDHRVKKVCTWAAVSDYQQFLTVPNMEEWKEKGVRYIWNGRTKQDMPLYYQIYENYLANTARLNILDALRKIKQSLLVIHGMDDETVSLNAAQQIHKQKADSQLFLVPKGTHTFSGYHPYTDNDLIEPLKSVVEKTIVFFQS